MSTAIEWAAESWNPIKAQHRESGKIGWHCVKVSPGCDHCYAADLNRGWQGLGTGLPYTLASEALVRIFLDLETLRQPTRWAKERRIFVCSMSDAFASFVDSSHIAAMFAVAALLPRHDFLFLTKRVQRLAHEILSADFYERVEAASSAFLGESMSVGRRPFANCWLGFSAESNEALRRRWPYVEQVAAAGWFVWCSAEPLLETIRFDLGGAHARLGWAVVGGESGRSARGCSMRNIAIVVEEFAAHNRPLFVKQIGSKPYGSAGGFKPAHSKGGDPEQWPENLRVRQFPNQ